MRARSFTMATWYVYVFRRPRVGVPPLAPRQRYMLHRGPFEDYGAAAAFARRFARRFARLLRLVHPGRVRRWVYYFMLYPCRMRRFEP